MTNPCRSTLEALIPALEAGSVEEVGRLFFARLRPLGVRASYIRCYRGGGGEQIYSRLSPPGWEAFYQEEGFGAVNYLPREIRRRTGAFAWSDVRLDDPREVALARALASYGFADGLAVPCHGAGGYAAAVSLAFEDLAAVSPAERLAVELASVMVHERMRSLSQGDGRVRPSLTPQERDILRFAAEGRSDDAICELLGLPHAQVARAIRACQAKLGVHSRAQALACAPDLQLCAPGPAQGGVPDRPAMGGAAWELHFRRAFRLSAAETRLAVALFEGETLKEIARRTGASVNTCRAQLAQVFAKTGVHRQSALVRLMSDLLRQDL